MRAPRAVVVGATDLEATSTFLGRFGFKEASTTTIDAEGAHALYGLDGPTRVRLLSQPGARAGLVSVVETPHAAPDRGVFDHGPLALDLYTTDLDADLEDLRRDGVAIGEPGRLELGPLVMRQVQVTAPDGWRVVLVEANHRRPSRLDQVLNRDRHSEVHSQLWTVPDLEAAAAEWTAAGWVQAHVFGIAHPELATILGLPSPDVELRMNLLVGDDEDPVRVELVEFPGRDGAPEPGDHLLRAGVHALWIGIEGLDEPIVHRLVDGRRVDLPQGRAVVGRLGGVRVECWAPPA